MVLAYPDRFVISRGSTSQLTEPGMVPQGQLNLGRDTEESAEPNGIAELVIIQNIISSFNLFIQIVCIVLIIHKKYTKKGPFFIILLVFSITVSVRIIVYSVTVAVAISNTDKDFIILTLKIGLYVDYCSNLFSVTITFFLSLNRCLSFVEKDWNYRIFEHNRGFRPIVFSVIISILGAMGIIITSKIIRNYYSEFGIIDRGPNIGFSVSINRFFNLFPVGSIFCYIILYWFLYRQNRKTNSQTFSVRRGEQKVFSQLIITASLYVLLNIVFEVVTLIDWGDSAADVGYIPWLKYLAIANYLPEISLPLLFVLDNIPILRLFAGCNPSRSRSEINVIEMTTRN